MIMMKEKKEKDNCKCKKTSIGGQAVLEGVMMRGRTAMATAVRDADGIIRIESSRVTPPEKRNIFLRLPLVRGVYSFVQSLFGGTGVLMRSADVYGEGEPSKFEKWMAEKLKVNVMNVVSVFSLLLGLVLAVVLFVWLPITLRDIIEKMFNITFNSWAKNFIEGGIKLIVFIGYICFCMLFKDVRRVFMYHGAEHKTISCYEKGLDLTVENAKKCTRIHNRCGTTFIVFVLLISIIVFAIFESILEVNGITLNKAIRFLCKICFLPIVAGLSYELLKALAKTDCILVLPLKLPGMLLQKITTQEPDDKMLEVAITAFNTVLEMDNDSTIMPVKFVTAEKRKTLTEKVSKMLVENGITENAEAEWIVSLTLNIKRDEVYDEKLVSPKYVEKVLNLAKERCTGRPLWYCVGDTDFYGYTIKVNENVLIPRPETEILVENAIKEIDKRQQAKVLDLCCGSGAIAVVISKEKDLLVTAIDISEKALEITKNNTELNKAKIEIIQSDLFENIKERKFDVIVSNPPYIKSQDIESLDREVKDFEPRLALDGGEDGLDFYRRIIKEVASHLNDNGVILMECGINQAKDIAEMFGSEYSVEIIKDYEKIDRIVKAVRNV